MLYRGNLDYFSDSVVYLHYHLTDFPAAYYPQNWEPQPTRSPGEEEDSLEVGDLYEDYFYDDQIDLR